MLAAYGELIGQNLVDRLSTDEGKARASWPTFGAPVLQEEKSYRIDRSRGDALAMLFWIEKE